MTTPLTSEDGTMTADLGHFNLANEMKELELQKPWPKGIRAKTLFKKNDFRVVLICMEAAAQIEKHHADGTSSVHVLQGHIRYETQGQVYGLQTGSLFTLGASIEHSVEAVVESGFLLTISWPHDQELQNLPHRGYGT